MRGEATVPAVMDLCERDVEGARALFLQLVVVQVGALAEHHLGHGVGEVDIVREAGIGLDDGGPAAFAEDDQVARLRQRGLRGRSRDEQEMDRPLQLCAGGKVGEGAVLDERRVERGERVVLVIGVAGQLLIDQLGPFPRSRRPASRYKRRRRSRRATTAPAGSGRRGTQAGQRRPRAGLRPHGPAVRESPGRALPPPQLARMGSVRAEQGSCTSTPRPSRWEGPAPRSGRRPPGGAARHARADLSARRVARSSRAGCERSPSSCCFPAGANWPRGRLELGVPFCSSSSASSRPPDLTMRPLLITCTRSGTM